MDPEVFEKHFQSLRDAIDRNDPDPRRGDWIPEIRVLDEVAKSATWLLDNLDGVPAMVGDQNEADHLRAHVIDRSATLAALLYCGQRHREARALLERCAALSRQEETRSLFSAGAEDLGLYIRVARARWLFNHDRKPEARKLAAELSEAPAPIAKLARRIERAPTPVDSPPTSFTLNGFGTKLYFDGEHEDDGSLVRTRFITALFIPVIPLDAWRVTDASDDQFYVHGKVPLRLPMRIWKYTMIGMLVAAIGWAWLSSWLDSPERALRTDMEAVAAIEADDPELALTRYEGLAMRYANSVEDEEDLLPISERWVALATRDIPEPLTLEGATQLSAVIARFQGLPPRFHTPALAKPWVAVLIEGVDQLGHESPESANASLDLLLAADRLVPHDGRVDERLYATRMALAEQLAEHWPIEAISQYVSLGFDARTSAAIGDLLAKLPESPTLFADMAAEILAWSNATPGSEWAVERVSRGLALGAETERRALLERRDQAELEAALVADPSDQVVAVALAELHRGRGEFDEAAARLTALGKPGVMTHAAQNLLAALEFDRGNLDEAVRLLEPMLGNRLPAFDQARRAYDLELEKLQKQLFDRAEQGMAPPKYQSDLANKDIAIATAAFNEWMRQEIEQSTTLSGLRDEYMRRSDIVQTAILLGTVQLEQARSATGDERLRLLDAAEQTFLSFRAEGAGMPDYHASLAQVYHRLGKATEGDAEFQILLDDPDPAIRMIAASGYRDLGRVERAREISEAIYEKAEPPFKQTVAYFRAILGHDLAERELWLGRADADNPYVRASLLEVKGDRLRLEGEFEAADAEFANAYDLWLAQVAQGASPNNAALALLSRHACTGDLAHVDKAVSLLEDAVAQEPDDAIVLANYASILDFRTTLALIDRVVPVEGLRIRSSEAEKILFVLLNSTKRGELLAALRESPQRQRVLDTLGRLETLAPSLDQVYLGQLRWLAAAENDAGLVKLLERIRGVENLDTSSLASQRADFVSGESNEIYLQAIDADLSARAAAQQQAKRTSDPVKAVLAYLDGEDLALRARVRQQPSEWLADIQAAVEAHERAVALWPEGIDGRDLADTRILQAVLELAAEDTAMAELWREHGREGVTVVLAVLLERGAESSPLVAKLAAKPAFQQGVGARATWTDDELGVPTLLLARVAGDETLAARTRVAVLSERARVVQQIDALLAPYDTQLARERELVAAELAGSG